MPALIGLAATWNPDLATAYGTVIGEPRLPRPLKELKGFRKVLLKPGEKQTVSVPLERSSFAFYDPQQHGWAAEKGNFKILIGGGSRDIRLDAYYRLAQTSLDK